MAVTVSNLSQGPGTLYGASFGTAEPPETSVGLLAAPTTGWLDVGGTTDGANLNIAQEFSELMVDQIVDVPGRRLTKRDMSLSTNLAEVTLDNMILGLNGGTVTTIGTAPAQIRRYEPNIASSATQPAYRALILDAFAPAQLRRRILMRRVLNTSGIEFAYKKDTQTVFTATWNLHYVSDTIRPFTIIDEQPAA